MRDRKTIEREMFNAREDLEESLSELKHVVQGKADVKARAQHAFDERVDRAKLAARRGIDRGRNAALRAKDRGREMFENARDGAVIYYHRAKDEAREHKLMLGLILGGVTLLAIGAVIFIRRRNRRYLFTSP
jgi:hypothetical protein